MISLLAIFLVAGSWSMASGQNAEHEACPRFPVGSTVTSPAEWHGERGTLSVSLSFRSSRDANGQTRYCYIDANGNESPTLRVHPGDEIRLKLTNELTAFRPSTDAHHATSPLTPCNPAAMSGGATNLHFHGLNIPPACHEDESLNTTIEPATAFEYRFRIPANQAPGLYWYHPHVHGHSEEQVAGGASGALIVEGIEQAKPVVERLPERVIVIREYPRADLPAEAGRPARDLSINYVPVPYPDYPMAVIRTKPGRRELWRVLNACADTYLDLGVLFNGKWRQLGLVAVDGVPLGSAPGQKEAMRWRSEIPIPPGGRAEFMVETPAVGVKAQLIALGVDTSPPGDEDQPAPATPANGAVPPQDDDANPPRQLARIIADENSPQLPTLPEHRAGATAESVASLDQLRPVRERHFYFSEEIKDPQHPVTSTIFYITEVGHKPRAYDASVQAPDITVRSGDVEDWVIENRSQESHAFHMHQSHFELLEREGLPAGEGFLRDTVDVPYWDGTSAKYPSVRLRMDFRDPNIVGRFPYHCHVLQHADGGMMGVIEVKPAREQPGDSRRKAERDGQ